MSVENPQSEPPLDIDKEFASLLAGHGETNEVDFAVEPLKDIDGKTYSTLRSDGSIENGWQPYEANDEVVRLKKEVLREGRTVTLTKLVDTRTFAETQAIAERLHERAKVGAEMAKRALMVQDVMAKKLKDTYPYNHRDDLEVIEAEK